MKARALSAFLASLCLTATSAQSAIVYSPGPATQCPSWFFPFGWSVDLDSDGVADFAFPVGPTIITMDVPTSASWTPFYVEATGTNEFLVSGYYSALQSFGAWVGNNPPLGAAWSTPGASALLADQWWSLYGRDIGGQLVHWGWGGPLGVSGVGYMGIRFYQPDGLHYGWIRVVLGLNGRGLGLRNLPRYTHPCRRHWLSRRISPVHSRVVQPAPQVQAIRTRTSAPALSS